MEPIYPAIVNPVIRADVRKYKSLDGTWSFQADPKEQGAREKWFEGKKEFEITTEVPGAVWSIEELSEDYPSFNQANDYRGNCWFRHEFEISEDFKGRKLWMKFGGVSPNAHIWLNGQYLGYHAHPIVGFKVDATDAVVFGATNVLVLELTSRDPEMTGGLHYCGPCIYCGVELEQTGDMRIEDLFIRPRIDEKQAWITAVLHNDTDTIKEVSVSSETVLWNSDETPVLTEGDSLSIEPCSSKEVSLKVDMSGCRLWTVDQPFLYQFTLKAAVDGEVVDAVSERFGMRNMAVEGRMLTLNHEPLMWLTSSPEFNNSPTISPIRDKELIRRRIQAMKDMGFNGNRLHTHVYTREGLDVCDEMGFILQVEPSVISNFNEIKPYPLNRQSLIGKVKEVRNHASVNVICMGNENSQIMHWEDHNYKERAKVHLSDIRDLVPDHLILTGCGYQGEYPDVYNDFQTPHLWSGSFKWAHEGLTSIPWGALQRLTDDAPIVLHEYGKMTVWPDPKEDEWFRQNKMPLRGNYGEMGAVALKEAGIDDLLDQVVINSRKLSAACTKIVLEEPRRQPGMCGIQYHCVLHVGHNRGFIDELGLHVDPQFEDIKLSNADTAILIDRDFRHRSLTNGQPINLGVYLSHFGTADIKDAVLAWSVDVENESLQSGEVTGLSFERGVNGLLTKLQLTTPDVVGKFQVGTKLSVNGHVVAHNHWDFWAFPHHLGVCDENILCRAKDVHLEMDLLSHFALMRRTDEFSSAYIGVNRWHRRIFDVDPSKFKAIVSDEWTEQLAGYVEQGGTALLIDRGSLPEEWYVPRMKRNYGDYDMFKLYTPFRTGWDHGNAATIIHDHSMLGDFPHEGWCDLHCFEMVNGAATLKTSQLPGKAKPIIQVVPIWRLTGDQSGPAPENEDVLQQWASENRYYLAESSLGKGKLIVCSLQLLNNTSGRYLIERIVDYIAYLKP